MQPLDQVAISIQDLETTINGHPDFFSRATSSAEAHHLVGCLWTASQGSFFGRLPSFDCSRNSEYMAVLVEMVVTSFGNVLREDHGTRESPN